MARYSLAHKVDVPVWTVRCQILQKADIAVAPVLIGERQDNQYNPLAVCSLLLLFHMAESLSNPKCAVKCKCVGMLRRENHCRIVSQYDIIRT